MIEFKNVSKYYHSKDVTNLGLHNVSVRFDTNEIVAITGDSGSGKSTLLNVLTKIDSFDEGEIYYKGNETSYFSVADMDDFRKNKIGFIFQNYNILDSYTVLENVMLPLTLKGMNTKEAKEKALALIEKVGLKDRAKARGTKLSGGEKQRCVIARALASDCEILACDEPTGNLDSKTGEEIINLIKEVAKDKLVLIVTHNFDQVKDICTRKIRVADGEIVEDVVYQTVEEDENVDLEMEYVPLKKRICARLAKNNVLFTPRKTILLSAILLVICVATLFLFQVLSASMTDMNYSSMYTNDLENRYLVYTKDHTPLDKEMLSSYDCDYNSWYEDNIVTFYIENYDMYGGFSATYSTRYTYSILHGSDELKDDEIFIILNEDYCQENVFTSNIIGKRIYVQGAYYKIGGIGNSKKITNGYILSGNKKLQSACMSAVLGDKLRVTINDMQYSLALSYNEAITAPRLVLPKEYEGLSISITAFGIYDFSCIDVVYSNAVDYSSFEYNDSFSDTVYPVYEASVYVSQASKLNALKKAGYVYDKCSTATNESKLQYLINNLLSYLLMILCSLLLIVVFFITYLVLSRVYASRKKDYEILRTLGITKKDMRHIVNYEVMSVSILCILLSFVIVVVLLNTIPDLASLKRLQVMTVLLYFLVTYLFGYCIARRFNRRLFRFSVTKSLKGDRKHD